MHILTYKFSTYNGLTEINAIVSDTTYIALGNVSYTIKKRSYYIIVTLVLDVDLIQKENRRGYTDGPVVKSTDGSCQ